MKQCEDRGKLVWTPESSQSTQLVLNSLRKCRRKCEGTKFYISPRVAQTCMVSVMVSDYLLHFPEQTDYLCFLPHHEKAEDPGNPGMRSREETEAVTWFCMSLMLCPSHSALLISDTGNGPCTICFPGTTQQQGKQIVSFTDRCVALGWLEGQGQELFLVVHVSLWLTGAVLTCVTL